MEDSVKHKPNKINDEELMHKVIMSVVLVRHTEETFVNFQMNKILTMFNREQVHEKLKVIT